MAELLSLTVTVGSEKAEPDAAQVSPPDGATVVLVVEPKDFATPPGQADLTWLRDAKLLPNPSLSSDRRTLTIPAYSASDAGDYTVGASGVTSNTVKLAPSPTQPKEDGQDGLPKEVVEVAVGVYDAPFARRTGVVAISAAAFVSVAVGAVLLIAGLASAGSLSERGSVIAPALAGWAGAIAIIGGVWMGILETRGRLSLKVSEGAPREGVPTVTPEVAKAANEFARTLTFARGTVAALLIGALLLCTSVVASCNVTTSGTSSGPSGSSTTQPTGGSTSGATGR
jgi:hypothetical protein